jgi:hypothetical protein
VTIHSSTLTNQIGYLTGKGQSGSFALTLSSLTGWLNRQLVAHISTTLLHPLNPGSSLSKRRLDARLQPQHLVHDALLLERLGERVALLGKVAPRLKVHGHEHVGLELLEQLGSVCAVHSDNQGARRQRRGGLPDIEERDRDVLGGVLMDKYLLIKDGISWGLTVLLLHLGQLGQVDGVAREVDGVGLAVGGAEGRLGDDETGDLTAGEMLTGGASDVEPVAADLEGKFLPKAC